MNLDVARLAADAVLYEGYLLYPYRASSSKNHARWQFGVLGPPGAAHRGVGEAPGMQTEFLVERGVDDAHLVLHLRFLQLQRRQLRGPDGVEVPELRVDDDLLLSWDEAVERELTFSLGLSELADGVTRSARAEGGVDVEEVEAAGGTGVGVVVRRRWPLAARLDARCREVDGLLKLEVSVQNVCPDGAVDTKDDATRRSFLGSHLVVEAHGTGFVSLLDPPESASAAALSCEQDRCWPVLSGLPGDTDLLLCLPIILYDYPEIAGESPGALFDATEIDEILTLRVLTMTDAEKAEARATDPLAREIIDRCDDMSPETLQQMHGALRSPRGEALPDLPAVAWPELTDLRDVGAPSFDTAAPWWDPATDAAVDPDRDSVVIEGVSISRGSLVRVHPNRRADAQDLFFAGQVARVTAVLSDVDGSTHVALVLVDDPASALHEEAGRYFYFAPDELEPLRPDHVPDHPAEQREEIRP